MELEKNKLKKFEEQIIESENDVCSKKSFENLIENSNYSSFHFGFKTKLISHQEITKLLKFLMNIIFSDEKNKKLVIAKNIISDFNKKRIF